jgi:hypothetical protein
LTLTLTYVDVIVIVPVIVIGPVAVHVNGNDTVIVIWPVDVRFWELLEPSRSAV